jgi:NAD(P)-dependent dehydrogenase (short-subunit alcohol dehydrogenase family)
MTSVFITGAARGIGLCLAETLAKHGWSVYAGYHTEDQRSQVEASQHNLIPIPCDVSNSNSVLAATDEITEKLSGGSLDLLINNAGITSAYGALEVIDIERFQYLFDVNLWGALRTTQALLPLLKRSSKPRIINICSSSVYVTVPLGAAYPVSKTALKSLTAHLRLEMMPFGIEVTSLDPGGIKTELTEFSQAEIDRLWEAFPDKLREDYRKHFIAPGEALADGFSFMATEDFCAQVYKKIICSRRLKPDYVIGKNVALLPWLSRLLPRSWHERLFIKVFKIQ